MAPVSEGADTTRLGQIAGQLRQSADETRTVGLTGSQLLTVLAESWMGPDMEQFQAQWSSMRPQVDAAADLLSRLEQELQRQADDQDEGSAGTGPAGGGGPARASGPSNPEPEDDAAPYMRTGLIDRMLGGLASVGLWGDEPVTSVPEEHRPVDPGVDGVTLPEGADPDSAVVKELMASPRGRETLNWMAENGVKMGDPKGPGAEYSPAENTMYVSDSGDAGSVIHEASHAQWDVEGQSVDPTTVSQEEYVQTSIDNETEATTEGIYYDKEMRMRGYPVEQSAAEVNYDGAYNEAIEAGKTPEEADAAGRERVREMFVEGEDGFVEVETSTTSEGYEEYYADQWAAANG